MSPKKTDITGQIEELIARLLDFLGREVKELENRGYGNQSKIDTSAGLFRVKGVLIPRGAIEYKIIYDHYEIILLQKFILLVRKTLETKDSPLIPFTLRTIWEMGVKIVDVLFASDVATKKRQHIKLLTTLTDLASIKDPLFNKFFHKLFKNKGKKLNGHRLNLSILKYPAYSTG